MCVGLHISEAFEFDTLPHSVSYNVKNILHHYTTGGRAYKREHRKVYEREVLGSHFAWMVP